MDEHPNATLVRGMVNSLNSGDMRAMADMLADDVEWHEIGAAEAVHGKAALAARFGTGSGPGPDYEISGELHDVVANGDHAVALVTATARRGGKTFTYRVAEIYHVRNGRIAERWAFSDDTAAINAFFA